METISCCTSPVSCSPGVIQGGSVTDDTRFGFQQDVSPKPSHRTPGKQPQADARDPDHSHHRNAEWNAHSHPQQSPVKPTASVEEFQLNNICLTSVLQMKDEVRIIRDDRVSSKSSDDKVGDETNAPTGGMNDGLMEEDQLLRCMKTNYSECSLASQSSPKRYKVRQNSLSYSD